MFAAFDTHRNVVLEAPPGAGKSTGVPLALLEASWLGSQKIVMLEPRRLAARAVATRMATLLGEPVGRTVGYRTRFDSQVSTATRIEVVTEGVLTRRLQRDQELKGVALVIFDEFHERSLQADLGLALCLDVQETLREDLRLLVMSATLDGAAIASLLGEAPRITATGQSWPVEIHYRTNLPSTTSRIDADIAATTATAARHALDTNEGDMLVFLPGQGEIRRVARFLEESALPTAIQIMPLYGDLPAAEQDAAIRPSAAGKRKIVLATNIAETSLTIEGVRIVVDSGWVRRSRFDPANGMNRLETMRISRAQADQRCGRAGRLGPGACYRLWTETEQAGLQSHTPAEILETDLAPLALELAAWGIAEPTRLRWLDVPPNASFSQARKLLFELAAIDSSGRITDHGRKMASLGTHPRLAHMLLKARKLGAVGLAAQIAALLNERDMLRSRDIDLRLRIDALRQSQAGVEVDAGARRRIRQAAEQLVRQAGGTIDEGTERSDEITGPLLACAYPDRIALSRERSVGTVTRYLLSGGRGAYLAEAQPLQKHELLVVAELDAGEREARIRLAAPIALAQLENTSRHLIRESERITWDSRNGAVIAARERWLGALRLEERPLTGADPEALRSAMLTGIRELGLEALPWTREARDLKARIAFARSLDAPSSWPNVDDAWLLETLDRWLAPWLDGITRREHLTRLDLVQVLQSLLDWPLRQRLDELAPTHLCVPSGSLLRLDYTPTGPVLAVRLQEVFGMTETPRVGGGRIPVTLHLLSPARRPVQVTRDLASFWVRGYVEVKKELKSRYPKHYWPEDPLVAEATAKVKRRRE